MKQLEKKKDSQPLTGETNNNLIYGPCYLRVTEALNQRSNNNRPDCYKSPTAAPTPALPAEQSDQIDWGKTAAVN